MGHCEGRSPNGGNSDSFQRLLQGLCIGLSATHTLFRYRNPRIRHWSTRPDSDGRSSPWEGDALPTTLLVRAPVRLSGRVNWQGPVFGGVATVPTRH